MQIDFLVSIQKEGNYINVCMHTRTHSHLIAGPSRMTSWSQKRGCGLGVVIKDGWSQVKEKEGGSLLHVCGEGVG